ncbi:zinc-finger of acetyl-transferase ESCO [Nakaseomyces glabratus]|nr:zinc-finger of acetyl-transferase ESCO [Nakaseomyces glabratus]KAH7590472.1 zinc-finger of acetyl-transferase ESCO [Nakaseomyces glabratus]KAI8396182.1 zinc-finger of acetyl-transferase ESCO [Nakaseomyces glabratus]
MAVNHVRSKSSNGKRLVQSKLNINNETILKCPKCEMKYSPNSIDDVATHKKYHDLHINGRNWSQTWGFPIHDTTPSTIIATPSSSPFKTGKSVNNKNNERIVMIQENKPAEVKAMLEIMDIVNQELNAPQDENNFWRKPNAEHQGKAIVYIKDKKAVGAITVEVLKQHKCRWMIYETRTLVEHVRPQFTLGISRIWVCRAQRGKGIAEKLLDAARISAIPGQNVDKMKLAWSQPSDSGGKLAKKYNGVKHKSGHILIPCYL